MRSNDAYVVLMSDVLYYYAVEQIDVADWSQILHLAKVLSVLTDQPENLKRFITFWGKYGHDFLHAVSHEDSDTACDIVNELDHCMDHYDVEFYDYRLNEYSNRCFTHFDLPSGVNTSIELVIEKDEFIVRTGKLSLRVPTMFESAF